MDIYDFVSTIEQDYNCEIFLIYQVGSKSIKIDNNDSDLDICVLTNKNIENIRIKNIDVWFTNILDQITNDFIFQFSPNITILKTENILYVKDLSIFNFIDDNKQELENEFLYQCFKSVNTNFNLLLNRQNQIKVQFNQKKRYKSRFRDIYFSLIILNNKLKKNNNIYYFSEKEIQNLRNIRLNDLNYSFDWCVNLINSYLTNELKEYYNNNFESYKNKQKSFELLSIIGGTSMNQAFINRYALLLKLAKNDFDFTLNKNLLYFSNDDSEKTVIDFFNRIINILNKNYSNESEMFWNKFIEVINLLNYETYPLSVLNNLKQIYICFPKNLKENNDREKLVKNFQDLVNEILKMEKSYYKLGLCPIVLKLSLRYNLFSDEIEGLDDILNLVNENNENIDFHTYELEII